MRHFPSSSHYPFALNSRPHLHTGSSFECTLNGDVASTQICGGAMRSNDVGGADQLTEHQNRSSWRNVELSHYHPSRDGWASCIIHGCNHCSVGSSLRKRRARPSDC